MNPTAPVRGTVTVLTSSHGPVSKRFDLGSDRKLVKTPPAPFYAGTFKTRELTPREFAVLIPQLTPFQFLIHGVEKGGSRSGNITTRKAGADDALTRTKDNFVYADEPGFLPLDFDHLDGTKTGPQLRDELIAAVPELANAAMVGVASASAMIYGEPRQMNELLRGLTGCRLYVFINNSTEAPRIGKLIHQRMLLTGHGRAFIRTNGVIEPELRSATDITVWTPERPDFAGGAALGPRLVQEREVLAWNPDAALISLTDLRALSPEDRQQIAMMTEQLRAEAEPEARHVHTKWLEARNAKDLKTGVEYTSTGQVESLSPDHDIFLANGTTVTGREIYENKATYHGAVCLDPVVVRPDWLRDTLDKIYPDARERMQKARERAGVVLLEEAKRISLAGGHAGQSREGVRRQPS